MGSLDSSSSRLSIQQYLPYTGAPIASAIGSDTAIHVRKPMWTPLVHANGDQIVRRPMPL
jgi:hypothetical protein